MHCLCDIHQPNVVKSGLQEISQTFCVQSVWIYAHHQVQGNNIEHKKNKNPAQLEQKHLNNKCWVFFGVSVQAFLLFIQFLCAKLSPQSTFAYSGCSSSVVIMYKVNSTNSYIFKISGQGHF